MDRKIELPFHSRYARVWGSFWPESGRCFSKDAEQSALPVRGEMAKFLGEFAIFLGPMIWIELRVRLVAPLFLSILGTQNLFLARALSGLKKCSPLASVGSPSRGLSFRGEVAFHVVLSAPNPFPHPSPRPRVPIAAAVAPARRQSTPVTSSTASLPALMRAPLEPSSPPSPRATVA